MNEQAERWIDFAQEDLRMAEIAMREEIFNQVCFHSQQCVEKALKSLMAEKGAPIPRTHRLTDLLEAVAQQENSIEHLAADIKLLDRYYIPTRYPDALPGTLEASLPDKSDALEALNTARRTLHEVERVLRGK